MRAFLPAAAALLLIVTSFAAQAGEKGGLAAGVFGGYSDWDGSAEGEEESEGGASAGLLLRYTAPIDSGVFVGFQSSVSLIEEAGWHAPLAVEDAAGTVSLDIGLGIDVLGIVGVEFLGGHLYAGAGIGQARGTISAEICGEGGCAELSNSNSHTGFKAVVGADIPVTDTLGMIVQIHYADYGDAEYFELPLELTSTGMIVGFLYRF